jgi:hypothetical protein
MVPFTNCRRTELIGSFRRNSLEIILGIDGSRRGENMMAFWSKTKFDALDRHEILQIIDERRLIFVRNNEGRINLVDCATVEESPAKGKHQAIA